MLVLRRRAHEAIVFDGGLVVTLADVVDHQAWLSFAAPSMPVPVVVAPLGATAERACVAVRAPLEVRRDSRTTTVLVGDPGAGDDTVLLVNASVGDRVAFDGLSLEVSSLDQGRVVLGARVPEISSPIGVSVFSVSASEVKIGIAAPDDVRVYREEVWLAMRSANQEAADWSASDLASLAGAPLTPARGNEGSPLSRVCERD
ncbi:MAG: carbon storage regulator [Actinomycetota bacterium]|nr:carbon storage regulator [Actinomycetota bacterium]